MPNASLCGKAVVEMVLGTESEAPYEYVTEKLVKTGDIPQAYVITKERIDQCRALESVQAQDEKWKKDMRAVNEMMKS